MGKGVTFYIAHVTFRVPHRVKLVSWSGVFSGKLVYDSLSLAGTMLPEGGLFRVSPVYPAGGGFTPVSGFLAPGERYRFRAVFWGKAGEAPGHVLARGFVTGLSLNRDIVVESMELREEKAMAPSPEPGGEEGEEPVAATIAVRHGPTFYRFHGALVAYPSPWRLVASIARRVSMATGVDYKPLVRVLQPCLELALDNTKKARIRLTHGKEVKVFAGEARYHLVCSKDNAERLKQLLLLGQYTGAGGSPGLGLGEIHALSIEPPRHQVPRKVVAWARG